MSSLEEPIDLDELATGGVANYNFLVLMLPLRSLTWR